MTTLKNDILKIKIVLDVNKSKICGENDKYTNLLTLIINNYYSKTNKVGKKMTLTDLNDNYFNFILKIINLNNIKILHGPVFKHHTIDKKSNTINTMSYSVSDIQTDTLKTIHENGNDLFFIYKINQKSARWYQLKDALRIHNRKMKIKKLSNLT